MKTGIFRLREADRQALTRHLLRLSPEDRRMRFFGATADSFIQRFTAALEMNYLHGFFLDGELVACSSVVPENSHSAEFAVTVDEAHRGRGLARQLLEAALASNVAERAGRLAVHYLRNNSAMSRLLHSLPGHRWAHGGELRLVVDLEELQAEELQAIQALCAAAA